MTRRQAQDEKRIRELSAREPHLPTGDVLRDLLTSNLNPGEREELERINDVRDVLERVAAIDRQTMRSAVAPVLPEDLDQARRWAAGAGPLAGNTETFAEDPPDKHRRGRRPFLGVLHRWPRGPLWVAAMTAIALAVLILWPDRHLPTTPTDGTKGREPVSLGSSDAARLSPSGDWDGQTPLDWDLSLPAGGWVELSFFADDDGQRAGRVDGPVRVRNGSTYLIPADHPVRDLDAWHWEVASFSGSGAFLQVARAFVKQSSK